MIWLLLACNKDNKCSSDEQFFSEQAAPLLNQRCYGCHQSNGLAQDSRLVLQPLERENANTKNWNLLLELAQSDPLLLLEKPTEQRLHGGAAVIDRFENAYTTLHELNSRLLSPNSCDHSAPLVCTEEPQPGHNAYRRLTDIQYQNSVEAVFNITPSHLPQSIYGPDFRTWQSSNRISNSTMVEELIESGELVAEELNLSDHLLCDSSYLNQNCLHDSVLHLAEKLYRRPLSKPERREIKQFSNLFEDHEFAFRQTVVFLLSSPHFLYIQPRTSEEKLNNLMRLDDHAVASQLSYFLWNRPPDAELLNLAEQGQLHTRAQVYAAAAKMVEDSKTVDTFVAFHEDWLNLYKISQSTKDSELYPSFNAGLREAMLLETRLFIADILWNGDAQFDSLFYNESSWVNSDLANLYRVDHSGSGWEQKSLGPDRRGILSRAAFLTAHAHVAASAPVTRGDFILSELLCLTVSVPSDVEMILPELSEETPTIRDRLEQHWTNPSCAGCHTQIDPLGFAFEHYDAIGQWRDTWENDIQIDASGSFQSNTFENAGELMEILADKEKAKNCYAKRWFEYAAGRPASEEDLCTLRDIQDRFNSTGNIKQLLIDVASSDPFLFQKSKDPQSQ